MGNARLLQDKAGQQTLHGNVHGCLQSFLSNIEKSLSRYRLRKIYRSRLSFFENIHCEKKVQLESRLTLYQTTKLWTCTN